MKTTPHTQPKEEKIYFSVQKSSLGFVLMAETHRGVCAIYLGDEAHLLEAELYKKFPHAECIVAADKLEERMRCLIDYIEQPKEQLPFSLDEHGTEFQTRVWSILRTIPQGSTMTYHDIAEKLDRPTASRAVANACAANNIAVVTPCHRVIRMSGELSGYRWGVERKQELLRRENRI